MIKKITKEELNNEHLNGKAILAFRATWCPPCQMMGPELQRINEEHEEINIFDFDIDKNREFAHEMKVASIPTFFLFQEGNLFETVTGYLPAEELIKKFN